LRQQRGPGASPSGPACPPQPDQAPVLSSATQEEYPMFISFGFIVIVVIIVLAVLFLRRR
jgi:nitrate reductase NapE component